MVRETCETFHGEEVKIKLLEGSQETAKTIGTTFGPYGKNVAMTKIYNIPHVTKDGVSVANEINLKDPIKNISAQIIKEGSKKTADVAGDGTTSTSLLTNALVERTFAYLKNNPTKTFEFKKDLELACEEALHFIDSGIKEINGIEDLRRIAKVASNGDKYITDLVVEAFNKIGTDGIVTVVSSQSYNTFLDATEGIRLDRTHINHSLSDKAVTLHKDCAILITDLDIKTENDAISILQLQEEINKPLLVICNDLVAPAAQVMEYNKKTRNCPVEIIRAPYIAEARQEALKDLAIATGAVFVTKGESWSLGQINSSLLGSSDSVEINLNETIILGRKGDPKEIKKRVNYYNLKIKKDTAGLTPNYKKRLGLLTSGAAVIYVGGTNEVEIKDKKDRLDDTIRAVKAAIDQGYVPGGCTTYYQTAITLRKETAASFILADSLVSLLDKLLANGELTREYRDTHFKNVSEEFIIDPALVIKSTIQNAVGAASMIFTINCAVVKTEE